MESGLSEPEKEHLNKSKDLTICHVNTFDIWGGAERIAYDLNRYYRSKNLESWLLVGNKTKDDPYTIEIPDLPPQKSNIVRLSWFLQKQLRPFDGSIKGVRQLRRWLRKANVQETESKGKGEEYFNYPGSHLVGSLTPHQPDILHCHNLHGNYFDLNYLPNLCKTMPTILTLHDMWSFTGHCANSLDCEKWRSKCDTCPYLFVYPPLQEDNSRQNLNRKKNIYQKSSFYIATPSEWLMKKVSLSIMAPAINMSHVIPNGVDLTIFKPANKADKRKKLGLPLHRRMILLVASGLRGNLYKDFETLRSSAEILLSRMKDDDLQIIALGDDCPDEILKNGRIQFAGFKRDAHDVADYYQAADLYLHAAHSDNFPTTILEALACGTPVVATSVGGIPEQVIDGQTGYLVSERDSVAMAAKTHFLLENENLRLLFGQNAANYARTHFDLTSSANAYLEYYEEIIKHWKKMVQDHE